MNFKNISKRKKVNHKYIKFIKSCKDFIKLLTKIQGGYYDGIGKRS